MKFFLHGGITEYTKINIYLHYINKLSCLCEDCNNTIPKRYHLKNLVNNFTRYLEKAKL